MSLTSLESSIAFVSTSHVFNIFLLKALSLEFLDLLLASLILLQIRLQPEKARLETDH